MSKPDLKRIALEGLSELRTIVTVEEFETELLKKK